ncbi:MAG: dihydrolipoyl dehydrogenase [Desulfobacterales bacterium]|nr:dihydrolipoyl dehydrogenase [Desulfobacterales bacterium]
MSSEETLDLIVIGSGPGGYVAAAKAAQLGMSVACIEKEDRLGGVCLNAGCIPSKALLDSSEHFHAAKTSFADHGIKTGPVSLDLATMMKRKANVVEGLTANVRGLLERSKVRIVQGSARIEGEGRVKVVTGGKSEVLSARAILLSTGSVPVALPGLPFDGKRILSSTEALDLDAVPEHLIVVGGGYIGLELGSVWLRLGAKVTVLEMLPQIAGSLDSLTARTLKRLLTGQGMVFKMGAKVTGAKTTAKKVAVTVEAGGKEETLSGDRVLVAVGRRPNTEGLGLESAGVATDPATGDITVDDAFQTSAEGIYAIGDLIAGPALAHKASAEGVAVAERLAGLPGLVNYDTIPSVIYTFPEVAAVGITEDNAKKQGIGYCVGTFPFAGTGRARCMGETDGFAKILTEAKTDRVLGVHIIGPRAAEMIGECVLAMEFGASAEDIARTVHGHPTFAEALQEAAAVATKCSVYRGPK